MPSPRENERISSAGELLCRRVLSKTATGFVPGQHQARILDPHPHRDRADLAAILTYVDDEGRACDVMCLRYGDQGWRAIKIHRAGLRKMDRATVVGCPSLDGVLLETVERAAAGTTTFPFEEPSDHERAMRRLANRLADHVEKGRL